MVRSDKARSSASLRGTSGKATFHMISCKSSLYRAAPVGTVYQAAKYPVVHQHQLNSMARRYDMINMVGRTDLPTRSSSHVSGLTCGARSSRCIPSDRVRIVCTVDCHRTSTCDYLGTSPSFQTRVTRTGQRGHSRGRSDGGSYVLGLTTNVTGNGASSSFLTSTGMMSM